MLAIHRAVLCIPKLLLLPCLLQLAGCTATIAKPQLYLLNGATDAPMASPLVGACAPVAVSARLPAYLQREGLVLQLDENELVAADSHLWAEPLVYGVERVLNLCLNPAKPVAGLLRDNKQRNVKVVIRQLHGDAKGTSRLQANWWRADAKAQVYRYVSEANQQQPGYAALVSTQRDLLMGLCEQIAAKLAHCTR